MCGGWGGGNDFHFSMEGTSHLCMDFLCKLIYVWKAEGLRSVLNSWMDSLRHFTM